MENEAGTSSRSISKDVGDLVDTYIALAKANVTQKAADAASFSISGLLMAALAFFALLFAGFALGWWLGELLSSMIAGFLIVSGIFVVLLVVLVLFKEQILHPIIRNKIVKKVYE
jgi:Putative Actinobacterial Holin-X, holin superfamily III